MLTRHLVVAAAATIVSSVFACTSDPPSPSGCTKDTDCIAGRICASDGRCVDTTTAPTQPTSCSTDGECKHVCVARRCVECRTDDDCRTGGSCYPDGRGDSQCSEAPCVYDPSPVDESPWVTCDKSTNTCRCTGWYRLGLDCSCEWR